MDKTFLEVGKKKNIHMAKPLQVIYPDFPLDLTGFFSIQFLANQMPDKARIFGISFYITSFSFFTLDKFT